MSSYNYLSESESEELTETVNASQKAAEMLHLGQTGRVNANTMIVKDADGFLAIRLYETNVVTFDHNKGRLVLRTGGWPTSTTKQRINTALEEFGVFGGLFTKRGTLYLWEDAADGVQALPFTEEDYIQL